MPPDGRRRRPGGSSPGSKGGPESRSFAFAQDGEVQPYADRHAFMPG
ncbi:MAG: hypothetical protein AVDCRST_MAG59-1584 [uncultured Thermomicrobiales bacterium]|uniref:Uncharacterized protein n=1 Tax=uncultured Thermomicrobiales bacterium TaxID=1645740 RepID=A0A6J4UHA9_9BACT|nr:MAG: hypothetical protein AVDCRST_MAG59-1584 [uncultured Thermomicrobiales bacterium]